MKTMNFLILLFACAIASCSSGDNTPNPGSDDDVVATDDDVVGTDDDNGDPNIQTVTYEAETADFANPDRGFYRYSEARASNYQVLSEELVKTYRVSQTVSGATYQTLSTLVFRYFILDDFVDGAISQEYLDNMQLDFDAARAAGAKIIPRFTYTVTANSGSCNEGFICPPYGDAPKNIVLAQIEQLGPVLTNNSDVIHGIQMGFIGTWGENYYTDYFGDASSNDNQGKLLDENWQDRFDVLQALLDATPTDIMIQVRYPQMKQRFIYGIEAATTVAAMTQGEGFSETDKARVGFHNDCLFASADDFGTYEDYGNSSSNRRTDITNLKTYFKDDSKYVLIGGETCADLYNPQSDCSPTGLADIDLKDLHYTYLNAHYNNEVNNDWATGGCIDAIKRNLGYRFTLKNADFPIDITAGSAFEISIQLENEGYASPVKQRNVKLLLRSKADSSITVFEFNTDVRFWFSEVDLTQTFTSESSLAAGDYEVLLLLDEDYETLQGRSEYNIRLANKDVWEESTGYNSLNHTITVN